jgi:hypothetical protein
MQVPSRKRVQAEECQMKALAFASVILVPVVAHADEILQTFKGSNQHTTRPFEVTGPWEIQWDARGDLFQLYLYQADGTLSAVPANQMGSGAGSAYQPHSGRFYLQMNALGSWQVTIVAVE